MDTKMSSERAGETDFPSPGMTGPAGVRWAIVQ
jgi:hypothetical protein